MSEMRTTEMASPPTVSEATLASRTGTMLASLLTAAGPYRHPRFAIPVGIAAFLVAFLARSAIDPYLPPGIPFLTFFPAVVLSAYLCGIYAGIVCATLSGVAAWYCFIPPHNAFAPNGSVALALALYALVVSVIILLIHLMQGAVADLIRAEAVGKSLLTQRSRLVSELERETERRLMHERLVDQSMLLDLALKAAEAGTWHYSVASGRVLMSAETVRLHGLGNGEMEVDAEREWGPLVHPDDAVRTLADLERAVATRGTFVSDFRIPLPTGETRWVSCIGRAEVGAEGEVEWVVGLTLDVTSRKLAELRIEHLARHDPLTGLGNRMQFEDRVRQEMGLVRRGGPPFALLCLDLDRFKIVNDTLGHAVGDGVLRVVADRLRSVVRVEDTVARLGGDEFVIIQTRALRPDDPDLLAGHLTRAVEAPMIVDGHPVEIGVSIGIALAPPDCEDPDTVYRMADRALYQAKAEGRGTHRWAT